MLNYWKDGKEIIVPSIGETGQVGQVLILGENFSRKQRKIEQLEGHIDLFKDILIKQGIRIVTEKQANGKSC